jgi:hypothetical protein
LGTDNLFHKRKAKSVNALQRRAARREAYAKILIVCEGEKTEPYYFEAARAHYRLNSVNVEVRGDCDNHPQGLVNFAKQRFREEQDAGDAFDKVFCVFDQDGHPSYAAAVQALNAATPKSTYVAITSVPCFEYWLLLHFMYSTRPYTDLPGNSSGHQVLRELETVFPVYQKGQRAVFGQLIGQLEFAINNAERALRECERNGTDNPSTRVHELIKFIRNIKQS